MPNAPAKPIEVARPGSFPAHNGRVWKLSEADLKAAAAAYDPALRRAPMVIGHPKLDDPAYGWAKGFEFRDGKLVATPDQVEMAFAEVVNDGRYGSVSMAFYDKNSPCNPKPGVYYPRHIGFLGAQAPSIEGLKAPEFAADETGVFEIEFAMPSGIALLASNIASLFRRVRETIIDKDGLEAADKAVPSWDVDYIETLGKQCVEDGGMSPAFAAPADPVVPASPAPAPQDDGGIAARIQAVEAKERDVAARETALAQREAGGARLEFAQFVDGLVEGGKVLPVEKEALVGLAFGDDAIEFAQGEETTTDRVSFLKALLPKLPKQWEPGEVAKPEAQDEAQGPEFAAPPGYTVDPELLGLHNKALAYQVAHPGTEYLDAYRAVGGR